MMASEKQIENIVSCIQDLREIVKNEPNPAVSNAIGYLDLFLEKLCTHELPEERTDGLRLRREVIYPLPEYNLFSSTIWAKLRLDMEVKLDELLSNYEHEYGFEPVMDTEAQPFLDDSLKLAIMHSKNDRQLELRGYKIYKKKVK